MRKLLLMMAAVCCCSLPVAAQQLDYLTFRAVDGTEQSLPLDGLKITFEGQQLHAVSQGERLTYALPQLAVMFFAETATGIESVTAARDELAIVNGQVCLKGCPVDNVQIYNLAGFQVANRSLSHGIYLVKVEGRTYKLLAK